MDGMWYKRCPLCGNYLKKKDPQESGMCCACGWEEYNISFFCEVVHRFCQFLSEDVEAQISSSLPEDRLSLRRVLSRNHRP